jgi:hypothetical protein
MLCCAACAWTASAARRYSSASQSALRCKFRVEAIDAWPAAVLGDPSHERIRRFLSQVTDR